MSASGTASRSLPSPWSWVSRIGFLLVLVICLFLLFAGVAPQRQAYTAGYIGVMLPSNEAGEVVLEVHPGSDAEAAGLSSGDLLLAIDGQPPRGTEDERYEQMAGLAGEPVTVTVRKPDGVQASYAIVRSSAYFNEVLAAGLTPGVVGAVYVTLSVLTGLAFALLGGILLLRGSSDWLLILGAFTLLLFPYSLNAAFSAYYGALATGLDWLYQFLRAAGLFLACFLLLVFPSGAFLPRWTRWLLALIGLWMLPYLLTLWIPGLLPGTLLNITWMALLALAILLQVFRHLRLSAPEEKTMARPMVVGAVIALVVYLFVYLSSTFGLASLLPGGVRWWYYLVVELVLDAALLSFGLGLLRSSLRPA